MCFFFLYRMVWYSKKHIWSLSQVPGIKHLIPLEYPEWGVSFVIHHEPLSITPKFKLMRWLTVGPLDSLRMGLVTRKTMGSEDWSFQPHPPTSSRKGSGLEIKVLWTLLNEVNWWASRLVNPFLCQRVVHPSSMKTEALALRTLPDLALWISSSDCLFVSFILSFVISW